MTRSDFVQILSFLLPEVDPKCFLDPDTGKAFLPSVEKQRFQAKDITDGEFDDLEKDSHS